MVFPIDLRRNWYDWEKGFENTNVGWYEHIAYIESTQKQNDVILWLYENVDNPERHCRWVCMKTEVRVKFRHEKDYLWFSLSF